MDDFMKKVMKRMAAFVMATLMVGSLISATAATRASDYFDSYYFNFQMLGSGNMRITYGVFGTETMSKIGVSKIWIEEEVGPNDWVTVNTRGSSYTYNDMDHMDNFEYGGSVYSVYRVGISAYAQNSKGSETKTVYSEPVTCKNK